MKCPECDNGKRNVVPVMVGRSTTEKFTEEELSELSDLVNHCRLCNGTGEVSHEVIDWLRIGRGMKAARLEKGFGMREAAVALGVCPSEYADMEQGRRKPQPELLDLLPAK